jgi:AMOP domain
LFNRYIWSALHPIGWWRNDEMKFYYDKKSYLFGSSRGRNWPEDQCRWWHQYRKYDRFWMDDLEICPPTVMFAIGDIGVWMPDPQCNMYGSEHNELNCLQHSEAVHCVITMRRT